MRPQKKKKTTQHDPVFVVCLNPRCPEPNSRCLDSTTIRLHPTDCSRHYYAADVIMNTPWTQIPDYPSDPLGSAVSRKIDRKEINSHFERVLADFRKKISSIIDSFEQGYRRVYPISYLEQKYEEIYGLQKISLSLKNSDDPSYISRTISHSMSQGKYNQLIMINEKMDKVVQNLNNITIGMQKQLKQIVSFAEQSQSLAKVLPSHFDKKINYGLIKSKYIASSKIDVQKGAIIFPKMPNVASFLPWIYTDTKFTTGEHELTIESLKFPTVANCGLLVLEEHDVDTYPYTYFKSLYSVDGKGFQLTHGSQIQHFIGQVTSIVVRLEMSSTPRAIIHDSELRCKYECELPGERAYRLGIYGSGWAVRILSLI